MVRGARVAPGVTITGGTELAGRHSRVELLK